MPHLLLLIPTTSYRTRDFLEAAERLGVEVAVGSNQDSVIAAFSHGRTTQIDFADSDRAVDQIVEFATRFPLAAIFGVDEGPTTIAALAGALEEAGVEPARLSSPLVFGTWVGGDRDGNPNITTQVTREVLGLQNERALRIYRDEVAGLARELSQSTRITDITRELAESLESERVAQPSVHGEFSRLNAE